MSKKIAELIQSLIPKDVAWKLTVLKSWPSVAGDLADKVSIFAVNDRQLILQASHPVWAQELNFLAPLIREKINALISPHVIETISFKIIKKNVPHTFVTSPHKTNFLHEKSKVPYAINAREKRCLALVKDESLRNILENYLAATKKNEK